MARWSVHLLDAAVGTEESPYKMSDGIVVLRHLPFVCTQDGQNVPTGAVVRRSWMPCDAARVAILAGLDWAYGQNAHVYRLSLGLLPIRGHKTDPLADATEVLAARNRIVVVAAGNWGPRPSTLSALARLPDVISVGATTPQGELLTTSSRGPVGGPGPTVVADGTDTNEDPFDAGTSFAAVRVARLCIYLRSMLMWLVAELRACRESTWPVALPEPSRLAQLDTGIDFETVERNIAQRSAGFIGVIDEGAGRRAWLTQVTATLASLDLQFDVDDSPSRVRRLLELTADGSGCPDPAGCGAGLVREERVFALLGRLTPSVFYALFGSSQHLMLSHQYALEDLDEHLGVLWDPTTFAIARHEYYDRFDDIFVRVL
jgi:hypothetical protein